MWDPHHIILMSGADTPREKPVGARRSRPSTVSLASFTGGNVTASCSVWELQMSLQSNRFLTTAQIFWVNPFEPINDYEIIEPFWNQCFFSACFHWKCSFCPPGQRVHLQVHHPVSSALLIGHRRPERGGVQSVHPRALHVHSLLPLAGEQRHQPRRTNAGVCVS